MFQRGVGGIDGDYPAGADQQVDLFAHGVCSLRDWWMEVAFKPGVR
jgi:hypothetical protein